MFSLLPSIDIYTFPPGIPNEIFLPACGAQCYSISSINTHLKIDSNTGFRSQISTGFIR